MSDGEKKDKEQPFDQLSKILRNNDLTKSEFTKLAHDHAEDALTKELSRSNVGGMSHFNCLYQMKLALISHLHEELKSFKPKKVGQTDTSTEEEEEIQISDQVSDALCANFDLVNEVIRSDRSASSQILQVLLDSIGRLNLNALSHEPTTPLDKLEEILQALLLEATSDHSQDDILSKEDQEKVFATAVELALTRASAPRLLTIIETLLTCTQSAKSKDLSFPLPRTLLTLANRVRSSKLYPPHDMLLVDEYDINTGITHNADANTHMGSMVSDGKYLWICGTFGLLKVGTGYHATVKSKIYAQNDTFYNDERQSQHKGCLILLNEPKLTLLFRSKSIEPHCFLEIDSDTLQAMHYMDVGDSNNYFTKRDDGSYDSEWLKSYTPSFASGKYLSVLRKTFKESENKNQYDVIHFDASNNYNFNHTVKLSGPINLGSDSVGGCYGSGGNMQGEFGLGHKNRQSKPLLLDWSSEIQGSFKQIAGGNQWHAYVTQSGDLYVAGQNSSGQCGLGHTQAVLNATLHEFYKKKGKVAMVGDGVYGDHMIVLMENGEVWSHGSGSNSQLGCGEDGAKTSPIRVKGLDGAQIVFVAADNRVSVFVSNKGEVFTCGYDDYGVLGQGNNKKRIKIPERVDALQGVKIVNVSHSYTHMLMLDDKGQVYSAGQNSYGQLGHGHKTNNRDLPKKIDFFMGKKVKKVSAGYYHSACLTEDNKVYMFGYGSNYALGTERTTHEATPVMPEFFRDKKIVNLVCGGFHTIWLTDSNELYSSGSNSYGECMIGRNGTVKVPTLCETIQNQQIVSINTGLYSSVVQTENTEAGMSADAMDAATFMSGPNCFAFTVPSGVRLGVTDETNLKYYDDQDGERPEVDISHLNEPRMRIFSGAGMKLMHQKDVILPRHSKDAKEVKAIQVIEEHKESKDANSEAAEKENIITEHLHSVKSTKKILGVNTVSTELPKQELTKIVEAAQSKESTISNKISCYESMTNCIWIFDPAQAIMQQYFSLDSSTNKELNAKEILKSPSSPETILIHPQFAIPSVAGELCEARRIVVALIAQLNLMASKQYGDWKKFVIGQNEDTFHSMFGILKQCWNFLENADSNADEEQDSKQMLFYGVLLQSIFGLLQINIENLPSNMFETEGVVLFAQENVSVEEYYCEISLALSRSIDAEVGQNIVIRANDREIALQVEALHHADDEHIFISKAYGFANLCIESNCIVSIDSLSASQASKITLKAIANDLKQLPEKFRNSMCVKKLYIEQYFKKKKDTLITNQTVITIKPIRKNKIDFEDEVIKNKCELVKTDSDLDNLPNLRFEIEVNEPKDSKSSHFVIYADKCEIVVDLKDDALDQKDEDIYFLKSYRAINQKTLAKLCSLLEEIITYPNSAQYASTFSAVYNRAKALYKQGYRTFFTTSYARCHHLYKWMDLHTLQKDGSKSLKGIERLLSTAIEILKETPEVSYLFYPKVAHEFGRNKATIISQDMLDEEEADAWLAKFVKSEQIRAQFVDNWSSANVEGTGRINWLQLQRILKIKDNDKILDEFKVEIGENKPLDFYDYAKCALLIKNGIAVDRPSWAKKKDIEATLTTFMPQISCQALQKLVSFIDGHTTNNIESIIKTKQIPKQLDPSDPELQQMALKLLVSVLNDLIRRSLAAGTNNKPLDRFPPLSQFISMVFETTFRFLRKSRDAQSILSPKGVTKELDSFLAYDILDASIHKLITNSNNLQVVLPYLVTNLTVLISNGWSHIRDLGQLALNLIAEMNGLTNILSIMDKNPDKDTKTSGLDSEISMLVESEHPYEGAKQRCFKCVLPDNVSFIVLEFDKQCKSAQSEDYVELFSGDQMSTKVFTRYFQNKWPASTLIIPGNKVRIEFNSVSDYNDVQRQDERWGFRATVKGYITPASLPASWIVDLEKQVGYLGALCASRLISSEDPTESERKIAHVLRSKVFQKGIASQYLHTEDGKLEFTPKSRYDRFLAKLVAEAPFTNDDNADKEDGKDDEKGDDINMASSGPHLLVDWMRRQRGGVEQLKSTAIGDGINKDDIEAKWVGWVAGFPRSFKVVTCDEFGFGLDYGSARIKIEVIRGSVLGKECGSSTDFSGMLDITDVSESHPLSYSKVSQLACCTSNDGKYAYIFGGYQPDNRESVKAVKYDVQTKEYVDIAQMPGKLRGAEAIAIGDNKIALSGTYPTGDSLWIYDEEADKWEVVAKAEKTGWEASIALDTNGDLHVIGGLQGHTNHLKYDFTTKTWTKLKDFPEPRVCGGLVLGADGHLYQFGGTNSRETGSVSDVMYVYDEDKDEWSVKCKLPKVLAQFAYTATNSQIVVFGGGSKYGNDVAPQYDSIFIYDFETQEWIQSEHVLPKKNREFAACFVNDEIHLFGGSSDSKKQDWHFIVRPPASEGGQKTIRQIAGKSPKEPVDFDEALITDFEDGTYEVETTINEGGLFYLRVLVNDHPILGSPFKVEVESSFNDDIEWGQNVIHSDKYINDMDAYYVSHNIKESWRDVKYALEGRKTLSVDIKPTKSDFAFNQICAVFVPNNVWNSNKLPKDTDSTHCVVTNEAKAVYKAVQLIKIEDEIDDKKEDEDEEEEEKKEDKEESFKKICYLSRDLEKYFNFGLVDEEWKVAEIITTNNEDKDKNEAQTKEKETVKDEEKEKQKADDDEPEPKKKEKDEEPQKEEEEDDDDDDEDKPDPMEPQSFFLCMNIDTKQPSLAPIATLIYSVKKADDDSGNKEDDELRKYRVPITSGDIIINKYEIIEMRDEQDLILPFGVIVYQTKMKQEPMRAYLSKDDSCSKFEVLDIMELEPILLKEKTEKKEELKIIAEEKQSTLPEWFVSLRSIQPGFPMKLYAIAYREEDKNMEKAVNWLLDKGKTYLAEHLKEFEDSANDSWNCNICTFLNTTLGSNCAMCNSPKLEKVPDYLEDTHKFWQKKKEEEEKKEDKEEEDDDAIEEILFGSTPYSGDDTILQSDKLLSKPFKLQVLILPKPVAYSPSANTPAARRAVRYVFAALLRHHGVVSEAITCVNFLETFGALTVQKSTHPLLNELARLWDVALALKHELAAQYDEEISNKDSSLSKAGSQSEYDTLSKTVKPKIKKDFEQRSDEEIRRELVKFKARIIPKTRDEMENKLMEYRLDASIRAKRCFCGSRMARMAAKEIYIGGGVVCDLCGSSIRSTLSCYHCPEKRNAHANGYDVCVDCVHKTWSLKDDAQSKTDDPYSALAKVVMDKITLLFQLYPANKDFGSSISTLIGTTSNALSKYDEPVSAPAVKFNETAPFSQAVPSKVAPVHPHILLRAVSAETKQEDHAFLADAFTMGSMTRTKSEKSIMQAPSGLLCRAKSTPNVGAESALFGGDEMFGEERSESRLRLSRVPDECESNEITQMIMYIVRKDIPQTMIRNALTERRLRAKQRIMGFRLFTSLFNNTSSNALHQDFAWLLASAIRQCVFEKIDDPKLGPKKKKAEDVQNKKKEEEEKKKADDIQDEEVDPLQDESVRKKRIEARKKTQKRSQVEEELKWKRDIWNDDDRFEDKVIHYLRGIEGSGPKLSNLTRSAFQKLYTKLTAIFRADSNTELNMGALGFLESWSIHFGVDDHAFLHDSQIFPVIRSLMSRPSSNKNEEGNNNNNNNNNNIAVFAPTNLTMKADIKVSTAQHRVNYMVDESTETFWQSAVNADNDQFNHNRVHGTHWVQLIFKEALAIKEIVWSLDSERDREYIPKCFQIYVGESAEENELVHTENVDAKFSGWYSIKMAQCKQGKKYKVDAESQCITAKFFWFKVPSIHGGQYEMRVRQLIVYGMDVKQAVAADSYTEKLQRVKNGALDLFRRLVSRTFLPTTIKAAQKAEQRAEFKKEEEFEAKEETKEDKKYDKIDDGIDVDDDDDEDMNFIAPPKPGLLRQKTTEVQEEMVGILAFMGDQGQKVGNLQRLVFELIFSEIKKEMNKAEKFGRVFYDLDYDNVDIPPIQRIELKKEKAASCLNDNYCFEMFCMILDLVSAKSGQIFIASPLLISTLFQIFARSSTRMQDVLISIFGSTFKYIKPNVIKQFKYSDGSQRKYDNLVDFFLYCIASSLESQMRGTNSSAKKYCSDLTLSQWILPLEAAQCKSVVGMLRSLLVSDNIWKQIIKQRLIHHILQLSQLTAAEDKISNEDKYWLIAASLCVIAGDTGSKHLDILSFDKSSPYHIDYREGTATIKVLANNAPIIIMVADLTQCKSLITFKKLKSDKAMCRFCDTVLTPKNKHAQHVCNDPFCIDSAANVCQKRLKCGHLCCGIRDEEVCLPCLEADCEAHLEHEMKEDRDTYCNICYTDTLAAQPTIWLDSCKHAFHYKCCHKMLELRWNGARITFGFRGCPLCKKEMRHNGLNKLNAPLDKLYEAVKAKSLMRLQYEKLDKHNDIVNKTGRYYNNPAGFALHKYAYYMCYKCQQPYYGGAAACGAAQGAQNVDPTELLCPSCSPIRSEDCPKHGKDYIEFKCRYCCTIAVWFCFGTTHFCEPCHNNNGKLTSAKKEDLVQCPCKPKGTDRYGMPEKLKDTKECPLGLKHPQHGEEFCLGCGLCRNKDF